MNQPAMKRSAACYFCSEFIEEQYLQAHINQCSQVLEQCRYKCGVYVPRRAREKHAQECTKRRNRLSSGAVLGLNLQQGPPVNTSPQMRPPPTTVPSPVKTKSQLLPSECLTYVETEVVALRSGLSEERRYRLQSQVDMQRLQKHYQDLDDQNHHISLSIDSVKKHQVDNIQKINALISQNKLEFEKLQLKHQLIEEWKKQLQTSIEIVRNKMMNDDNRCTDYEMTLHHLEQRLLVLERLEAEIESLRNAIMQEQTFRDTEFSRIKEEFMGFKEYLASENVMISGIWNEQLEEVRKFKGDLQEIDAEVKNITLKHHATVFEVKSNTQLVQETAEKIDCNAKEIDLLKKALAQLRQDFQEFEMAVCKRNLNKSSISCANGHLLWRIDSYAEKLSNAKDNDAILRSPIFLSKPYGYTLRIEIQLNGIGRWKGRHMIVGLQVLKGDWDVLLDWPCNLPTVVVIKDQHEIKSERKDLIKTLTAKKKLEDVAKEELSEMSGQHIFVPHTTLDKQSFIKDDVLFVEVTVNNIERSIIM